VSDISGGQTPAIARGKSIWSTPSCVAFGCLMEQDGPTTVTIGSVANVGRDDRPAFDGMLETPTRTVVVSTVDHQHFLKFDVAGVSTRLRIWANHPSEPDEVVLGVG